LAISNNVTVLLSGNTAGTNALVAQNLILVGGHNVTLSGDPRGSVVFLAGNSTGSVIGGGTSSFTTIISMTTYRSDVWSLQGVVIQSSTPGAGVQYSQWLAGSTGYWGWIQIP
jgi:hypothetical protein